LREKKTEDILKLFDRDIQLRKKKDLIKKFIEENLPKIDKADSVEQAFSEFWASERSKVLKDLAETEKIPIEKIENLIGEYLYSQKLPQEQEIADLLPTPPKILERKGIISRIKNVIEKIVDVFEW
jgi:type I restriction enzyme R subunit